jgi:mannose/fructose/N-acetylgalactosamine-specific phosphotransferase system component IIB
MQTISRSKIAEERETDSLNDLFKEEVMIDLSFDLALCDMMAKKSAGAKKNNWENMALRIEGYKTYIDKIHSKAKREYLINDLKPSDIITLLNKNKRLERLNLSLMQQNDKLKTQIDNYVSKFGL